MRSSVVETRALILFAHGARDRRWAEPLTRIRELILQQVDADAEVHLAFLELMAPTLPQLVAELVGRRINHIVIVPVFLGQGAHVRKDLPVLVGELQSAFPDVILTLADAIGESELVLNAIAQVCASSLG